MQDTSTAFKVGTGVAALLGIADVLLVGGLTADDGPPAWVIIVSGVLGVLTLAALRPMVRGHDRARGVVVVSRVLSALLGVPAFFVDDAPSWAAPSVAVSIVLTAVAVVLLARGRGRVILRTEPQDRSRG